MADAPDPLDLIGIDALLSDEERQIRDLARRWVVDRILPEVEDWYERGEFPARELATELGKLGFKAAGHRENSIPFRDLCRGGCVNRLIPIDPVFFG